MDVIIEQANRQLALAREIADKCFIQSALNEFVTLARNATIPIPENWADTFTLSYNPRARSFAIEWAVGTVKNINIKLSWKMEGDRCLDLILAYDDDVKRAKSVRVASHIRTLVSHISEFFKTQTLDPTIVMMYGCICSEPANQCCCQKWIELTEHEYRTQWNIHAISNMLCYRINAIARTRGNIIQWGAYKIHGKCAKNSLCAYLIRKYFNRPISCRFTVLSMINDRFYYICTDDLPKSLASFDVMAQNEHTVFNATVIVDIELSIIWCNPRHDNCTWTSLYTRDGHFNRHLIY